MSRKAALMLGLLGALVVVAVGCKSLPLSEYDIAADLEKDGRYEGAIPRYEAYIAKGEGILVPHAQFRIARCYQARGMYGEALKAYQQVIDKYGDREVAGLAKEEMKSLQKKIPRRLNNPNK